MLSKTRRVLTASAAAAVMVGSLMTPAAAAPAQSAGAAKAAAPSWVITPGDGNNVINVDDGVWQLPADGAKMLSAGSGERIGTLSLPVKSLGKPVNTFDAAVDATIPDGAEVAVDVRGMRSDGQWSDWTEILPERAAVLSEATRKVQARLVLIAAGTSPEVRSVELTARKTDKQATERSGEVTTTGAGRTYRIFATREGLVGGTTANGHVIVERDHFAALPSRRGLADRNRGNRSVRVCRRDIARCEWAPVWDVGPWNTKDDYWNPSSVREMWKDLPQGRPESQAAYYDNYNGGKDQFGRTVVNPAGIDLADGMFWDGLLLNDNAWVNVTYMWTGSGGYGTVVLANSKVMNVRGGPSTNYAVRGKAARYAEMRLLCRKAGQRITGTQGTTSRWFKVRNGMWVSAAYVRVHTLPPVC